MTENENYRAQADAAAQLQRQLETSFEHFLKNQKRFIMVGDDLIIEVEKQTPVTKTQADGPTLNWLSGTLLAFALGALAAIFVTPRAYILIPITVMACAVGGLILWAVVNSGGVK